MTWVVSLLDSGAHYSDTEAPYIYGAGAVRSNAHLRTKDPYGIKLPAGDKYQIYSTIFRGYLSGYKSFAMGAAFYFDALPATSTVIMGGDISSTKKHFYLTINSTGTLSVWYKSAEVKLGIATLTTGKHYYIELCGYRTLSANDGGVSVAVDGETVFSQSSMMINTAVTEVWFNAPTDVDLYLSGIYLLRGQSESPIHLGPIWVKALTPTVDGEYSELTPSTGTDHYAVIDESPPSTTDYLGLNEEGPARDLFTLAELGETDAVKAICPMVYAEAQTQDETAGQVEIIIRTGTTDFIAGGPVDSDQENPYYSAGSIYQPATAIPWTAANIASSEFGFRITGYTGSPDNEMRASQFIVLVALEYATTGGGSDQLKVAQQLLEVAFSYAGDNELPFLFTEWEESYERCLLFEIEWLDNANTVNTEYVSNIGYTSFPGDNPENQNYPDLVVSMPSLSMRIDEMTQISELVIYNKPEVLGGIGPYDLWHQKAVIYQEIRCYIGKRQWARSRFKQFFHGVITAIRYDKDSNMVLSIADRSALLDKRTKTQAVYGRVFNCEPYYVGPGDPIYYLDQTTNSIDAVTDVRDNGVSLGGSPPGYILSDGNRKLTLESSPAGRVTFDADKYASPTAINVIGEIMDSAGFDSLVDMDLSAMLDTNYIIGYYVEHDQEVSYLDILRQAANSAGGYCHFSYEGILTFYNLDLTAEPIVSMTIDDVIDGELEITEVRDPAATFKLGYKKNWSVQDADALSGLVTDADRQLYSAEWSYYTIDNGLSDVVYPNSEDVIVETLLQDSVEAETETGRRAEIRSIRNYTIRFMTKGLTTFLKLGDNITIDYPRYGLSGGKVAAIIGLDFKPDVFKTEITLWTTNLNQEDWICFDIFGSAQVLDLDSFEFFPDPSRRFEGRVCYRKAAGPANGAVYNWANQPPPIEYDRIISNPGNDLTAEITYFWDGGQQVFSHEDDAEYNLGPFLLFNNSQVDMFSFVAAKDTGGGGVGYGVSFSRLGKEEEEINCIDLQDSGIYQMSILNRIGTGNPVEFDFLLLPWIVEE